MTTPPKRLPFPLTSALYRGFTDTFLPVGENDFDVENGVGNFEIASYTF